jgi:hypothetical protein
MKHKFFKVPVSDPVNAETELNTFISQHRIAHIDRYFVADGANSFWSKQNHRYVSNDCGCFMNACRTVVLFQGDSQNLTQSLPR